MKKIIYYIVLLLSIFIINNNVYASEKTIYVNLNNLEYSSDSKTYTDIKKYDSLDTFLTDYNKNNLPSIYITNFLFDGVSTVKTPDLDDFIEEGSNDTKIKTLDIQVININTLGNIELTGTVTNTMLGVNTNNLSGNINLILNNVNIDSSSKKAPAIYIYNKDITCTKCIVTIKTLENTKNYLEGGKLKKVSLIPSDKLSDYSKYYTDDSLTNYEKYTSYYGMYTSSEIENILFATVTADTEDLADGDPYYFYKGSGAISSDIDLYFEGKGYLKVTSKNKEGIETKGNMTFSGSTGDYEIYAYDDCLNTTTASSSTNNNIRNDMTIDVNSLLAIVSDDGDEGDAIDSNGKLTINNGTIYAYAHSNSQDSGLDASNGIYINGGIVIGTGNMSDEVSSDSKQDFLYVNLKESIESGTTLLFKDNSDNILFAFTTSKTMSTLLYSSSNLNNKDFKIYKVTSIEGTEENGLYTKVDNYELGEEVEYTEVSSMMMPNNNKSNFILIMLLSELSLFVLLLGYIFFDYKKHKSVNKAC